MGRRIGSWLMVFVLLCALALPVWAHEVPDETRLGSISITMTHQGEPVPGGSLKLYMVADVVSENGDYFFAYTEDFAGCSIPVTELDSAELPQALADIAEEKNLPGAVESINNAGRVKFGDLELGLYLVVQEEPAPGFKKINPFLVSVPRNDDGRYIYDVDTAPKNLPGPEEEPTTPPTEPTKPPEDPELPKTGQMNWPVPVLAVAGLLLVTAGFALWAADRRKEN